MWNHLSSVKWIGLRMYWLELVKGTMLLVALKKHILIMVKLRIDGSMDLKADRS